jgi:hypothetical protein
MAGDDEELRTRVKSLVVRVGDKVCTNRSTARQWHYWTMALNTTRNTNITILNTNTKAQINVNA